MMLRKCSIREIKVRPENLFDECKNASVVDSFRYFYVTYKYLLNVGRL